MKYTIKPTSKFQKDLKRVQKRGYDIKLLKEIIEKLSNGESLPPKNRDHNLSGNYSNCRVIMFSKMTEEECMLQEYQTVQSIIQQQQNSITRSVSMLSEEH